MMKAIRFFGRIGILWIFGTLFISLNTEDNIGKSLSLGPLTPSNAKDFVRSSGVQGGLIVHLGCGEGKLTSALRVNNRYLVHGLDRSPRKVASARQNILTLGLYGTISVDILEGKSLPYADNLVNLVVAEDLGSTSIEELLRVLTPHGMVFIKKANTWSKIVKPWPQEMGEWTHFRHDSDNNPVARDTLVGPPRGLQWRSKPQWLRSHEFTSSLCAMVSAQGRVFYILDEAPTGIAQDAVPEKWTLIARDAFNGVLLWKRPLTPWGVKAWKNSSLRGVPHSARECLVAEDDRVFVTLGFQSAVSILDAATGRNLAFCQDSTGAQDIRCERGILLVNKDGNQLLAFDARDARPLWKIDARINTLSLIALSDRIFYYDTKKKALMCHQLTDGKLLWQTSSSRPGMAMAHKDRVLLACGHNLLAISTKTGDILWTVKQRAKNGKLFVAQELVWIISNDDKHIISLDLATGEKRSKIETSELFSAGHHPRCYPIKASKNYLITQNRGAEFFSLTGGEHSQNDWIRGACTYGVMPCNGMLYAPPHPCFCYAGVNLNGLNALTPIARTPLVPVATKLRLKRGPAYEKGTKIAAQAQQAIVKLDSNADWPMYRHDPSRTGATSNKVSPQLTQHWQVSLRGPLTPPVSSGGKLYVAAKDEHTLYALDIKSGRSLWEFTAGGRIDSPPTVDGSRVLFGCTDGNAYCLWAADGALVWRFQAAPTQRRIVDRGQLESPWRVHGSILLLDGIAYLTAGRSSFLDGGIWIFGLNARTGQIHYQTRLDTTMKRRDDAQGKPFLPAFHIEGAKSDILVSQNDAIYLGQFKFDTQLVRQKTPYLKPAPRVIPSDVIKKSPSTVVGRAPLAAKNAKKDPMFRYYVKPTYMATTHPGLLAKYDKEFGGVTCGELKLGLHLMATHGFLDDSAFNRAFWTYSDVRQGMDYNRFNRDPRNGELLVITPEQTYLVRGHPERAIVQTFKPGEQGYLLAAMPNSDPATGEYALVNMNKKAKPREVPPIWSQTVPLRIRSMVLASKTLFVCGVPDVTDPADPLSALEGRKGAKLQAYSAVDGRKLAEYPLESPAVFDGLIAARGRLYLSTRNGKVVCMATDIPRDLKK